VVEATHLALGQRVAIKVLQGEAAVAPEVLERFRREAQIAAQLPGDHIARVTDLGLTEVGEPYLVMELLVGRDLESELRIQRRLPVDVAVDYILQACEGVAEAHAAGLVHRDLKPGNLFLTRRRDGSAVIKVLDFGISKAAPGQGDQALTKTATNFGTPLYMSPEQIQSAKHVDARSDQHALAAILYALITGHPPFAAESLTALAVIIATETPRPASQLRSEVPKELDAVLARSLSKRPNDRYAELASFARAIARFGGANADASIRTIAHALAYPDPSTDPGMRRILDPRTPGSVGVMVPSPSRASAAELPAPVPPPRELHDTPTAQLAVPAPRPPLDGDTPYPGQVAPISARVPHEPDTIPGPSALAAQTSAALSTAIPLGTSSAVRRKAVVAAAGSAVVLVVGVALVLALRSGPPTAAADGAGTVAVSPVPTAESQQESPPVAEPAPAGTQTTPTASATASAKPSAKAPHVPTTPKTVKTSKPTEKDPTEVFGARRR